MVKLFVLFGNRSSIKDYIMSKIGRKPILVGAVTIQVQDLDIHYKGAKAAGVHVLPVGLKAELREKELFIVPTVKNSDTNRIWGLHRALVANKIIGADQGFVKQLRIIGLGFKALMVGGKLQFSLGYSHKIDFTLPATVTIEIDKTGQLLTFKSADKTALGLVCSEVRALRCPEPYKGTGICYVGEVIRRKAGKAKSS